MLLDFSVDWRWVIGGTDVSPFVETWELAREQPDMGTPAWWRGKLVLRPVVGRDLNLDPLTNPLWRQGTSCSLTVAGYLVFTGSILLAYYDDWSTAPRLELEVGDVLAAKNHRQVIPFGEYNPQSLLAALGIYGLAPEGDKVELSTDLTSPVKVAQELTWVAGLKYFGRPATLFTRRGGEVSYEFPRFWPSLTRTLEQVADFTRQRPALEIPGSVIASASLTYLIQLPSAPEGEEAGEGASGGETVLVSQQGDTAKVTYLDSLGRPTREETYQTGELVGYAKYRYYSHSLSYELVKEVTVKDQARGGFKFFEYIKEKGGRTRAGIIKSFDVFYGRITANKETVVFWPGYRFFPTGGTESRLAYIIEEYEVIPPPYTGSQTSPVHFVRLITRAKGTTQDVDTYEEALTPLPTVAEIIPNQGIQLPDWVQSPQADDSSQTDESPPKFERITDTLSEEVEVEGFTGPPVYVTVPWLSVTVDEQSGRELEYVIEDQRQSIRRALRAAATWMATEIAGRAFARRIKMPVPREWLEDPRPWTQARIGDEVLWLVGETLRGTAQGVEFEATGILAGRPITISDFPGFPEFPDFPDSPDSPGTPSTVPNFLPLVTVSPTRFPQVGIGCEMRAGEALIIPGDPWLGMAVEIEYAASDPAASVIIGIGVDEVDGSRPGVGAGWLGIPEVWLGLTADATYEITGEEEEDGEAEGLTLEAEDGATQGAVVIYDANASSCYAVTPVGIYCSVYFSIDSTSLDWERPLRLRIIYKSAGDGAIDVFVGKERNYFYVDFLEASQTFGYVAEELVIPTSLEPFDEILIDIEKRSDELLLDAIQLAPADGDWPPLNPCSD